MNKHKHSRGFTLVELLVVIAIIGILASVVLVSLNSARGKARDARRISDLHQLALAMENYYDAHQAYPTNVAGLAILVTEGFMASVPTDPSSSATAYTYVSDGCPTPNQKYVMRAVLENHVAALDSDGDGTICGLTTCGTQGPLEREYCISP